ncbi:TlpA family protein disulfide reductase [Winogradskyella sp. 4-2091]|uniref:TlpA family protein disulfide reductase n=1 Tax=Winogradskyella sp. 4-2091 TaxID=3381659 RepID=UPI003891771B
MNKALKSKILNFIFLFIVLLMLIPQTRQQIQIIIHKAISIFNPVDTISKSERIKIESFNWKLLKEDHSYYNFESVKSKVTVVNFWATWCPPCIAEMPSLQKLYESYGDKVEFLFVTSEPRDIIKAFKDDKQYTFPVYIKTTSAPKELKTTSIPRTLVINKKGEIIIDKSSAVDWNSEKIRNQLDELLLE